MVDVRLRSHDGRGSRVPVAQVQLEVELPPAVRPRAGGQGDTNSGEGVIVVRVFPGRFELRLPVREAGDVLRQEAIMLQ